MTQEVSADRHAPSPPPIFFETESQVTAAAIVDAQAIVSATETLARNELHSNRPARTYHLVVGMRDDFVSQATSIASTDISAAPRILQRIDRRAIELLLTTTTVALLAMSFIGEALSWPRQLMLAINVVAYATGGYYGVRDTIVSLSAKRLDINLLMILAALGAAAVDQWREGIILLFLFSLSNTLQTYAMERSRNAIRKLLKLRPTQTTVLRDGEASTIPVDALQTGDVMLIRPGELIAADGVIREGRSDLDQASVTGESMPVEKGPGELVFAGTLNGSGAMEVEVSRPVTESTLERIIQLVEKAQSQKDRTQSLLERIEGPYAVLVIAGATLAAVLPPVMFGADLRSSFYRAMVLLVVASPCALIISTPAAILSAIANAARRGILFKGGVHLERLAGVKAVAFDKTGTLTSGKLRVTDVVPFEQNGSNQSEAELRGPFRSGASRSPMGFCDPTSSGDGLLALAASLESRSEHPIARAVGEEAKRRGLALPPLDNFRNLPGRGVHARASGYLVWIGGEQMYREHGETVPLRLAEAKSRLESEGKTVLLVHREVERSGSFGVHEDDGGWLGLIAVADTVRPEACRAVAALKKQGIRHTVMLTGDNPRVAATIARQVGVDEYLADLLPEDKVKAVHDVRARHGLLLMVGDGVNDAPALAAADVGAAMGAAGSDVALETADLVLMSDELAKVPYALQLGRRTRRVVAQNLTFSLSVIVLLIIAALGWNLALPAGVIGHEGCTLLVVANGLRLLVFPSHRG